MAKEIFPRGDADYITGEFAESTTNIIPNFMYKDDGKVHTWEVFIIGKGDSCAVTFVSKDDMYIETPHSLLRNTFEVVLHDICSLEFVSFMETHYKMENVKGIILDRYDPQEDSENKLKKKFLSLSLNLTQKIYFPLEDIYEITKKNEIKDYLDGEGKA